MPIPSDRHFPYGAHPGPSWGVKRQYPFISRARQLPWSPEILSGPICPLSDCDRARNALRLGKLDPVWDELFSAERERVVRLLVKETVLSPDGLTIRIRTNGLRSVVPELRDGAGGLSPATLRKGVPLWWEDQREVAGSGE